MPNEFDITLATPSGGTFKHNLVVGTLTFLLGANGTGKSALVQRLYARHRDHSKRISAHRQVWISTRYLDMTPSARQQIEQNVRAHDASDNARHTQFQPEQRPSMAVFDVIDTDTTLARKIADLVRAGDSEGAKAAAAVPGPLARINNLLRCSNISVQLEFSEGQSIVARKDGGTPFSVAELSDGERNAFLIAAEVLTAPPGTLLLIDEPERHLHRSIVSPLLSLLFQQRSDCAFLVSTHELMLPIDNPTASTLLVRNCAFSGSTPQSWSIDVLPSSDAIDNDLKVQLLGARNRLLFVEGDAGSLDAPLYNLLFPGVTVIAAGSWRDVEKAVGAIRNTAHLHWLKATGVIDSDGRDVAAIGAVTVDGVCATPLYSVEALYYHPEMFRRIAALNAQITGRSPTAQYDAARLKALQEIRTQRDHLIARTVARRCRQQGMASLPTKAIDVRKPVAISIDVPAIHAQVSKEFDAAVGSGDLEKVLRQYPVRESGALSAIAQGVGMQNRSAYETAVRQLLTTDATALDLLRKLFGPDTLTILEA